MENPIWILYLTSLEIIYDFVKDVEKKKVIYEEVRLNMKSIFKLII